MGIKVAGQEFDCGAPVVLWDDVGGLNLYPQKKFWARSATLEQLQSSLDLFVLHHSVTYRAKDCYNGLIARGLSVNFIIDDDDQGGFATIYQCLDVKEGAFSHKPLNKNGPGVEICYMPDRWINPNRYSPANQSSHQVPAHPEVEDRIHGQKLKVFGPTAAQVASVLELLKSLHLALPEIDLQFPKDDNGDIVKTVIKNPTGLVHHFHITREKIDAIGFPSEKLEADYLSWLVTEHYKKV